MGITDIRILTAIRKHPKRSRLASELQVSDAAVLGHLVDLWIAVAESKPNGVLDGWDEVDIACAAGWSGEAKLFTDCLIEKRWIDRSKKTGVLRIHDWRQHQPHVCAASQRSKNARIAAFARWEKDEKMVASQHLKNAPISTQANRKMDEKKTEQNQLSNAPRMRAACGRHAECNAPTYLPISIRRLPKGNQSERPGLPRKSPFKNLASKYVSEVLQLCKSWTGDLNLWNPYAFVNKSVKRNLEPLVIISVLKAVHPGLMEGKIDAPWAYATKVAKGEMSKWHQAHNISQAKEFKKAWTDFSSTDQGKELIDMIKLAPPP